MCGQDNTLLSPGGLLSVIYFCHSSNIDLLSPTESSFLPSLVDHSFPVRIRIFSLYRIHSIVPSPNRRTPLEIITIIRPPLKESPWRKIIERRTRDNNSRILLYLNRRPLFTWSLRVCTCAQVNLVGNQITHTNDRPYVDMCC